MSALIDEFKKEHSKIIAMLREVKELGILSKEGQTRLMSVKEVLLEHLKKEDEYLYPVIRKEAVDNKKLQKVLDVFTMDPEYVSRVVREFFDRYSSGTMDENVKINFESLFAAICARIRNEEDALYEEYEKMGRGISDI